MAFVCLSSCFTGGLGVGIPPCHLYQYNEDQGAWINPQGQAVQCTLADGNNILDYIPNQGCKFWQKQFSQFKEVKISEVLIQEKDLSVKKYCVLSVIWRLIIQARF